MTLLMTADLLSYAFGACVALILIGAIGIFVVSFELSDVRIKLIRADEKVEITAATADAIAQVNIEVIDRMLDRYAGDEVFKKQRVRLVMLRNLLKEQTEFAPDLAMPTEGPEKATNRGDKFSL